MLPHLDKSQTAKNLLDLALRSWGCWTGTLWSSQILFFQLWRGYKKKMGRFCVTGLFFWGPFVYHTAKKNHESFLNFRFDDLMSWERKNVVHNFIPTLSPFFDEIVKRLYHVFQTERGAETSKWTMDHGKGSSTQFSHTRMKGRGLLRGCLWQDLSVYR